MKNKPLPPPDAMAKWSMNRKRPHSVHLMLDEGEYAAIKEKAKAVGLFVSQWIRAAALEKARG